MGANEKCTVSIDATEGVARVIFANNPYTGIEYPGAVVGDVITIDSGVEDIVIYNGADSGILLFDISFSGA